MYPNYAEDIRKQQDKLVKLWHQKEPEIKDFSNEEILMKSILTNHFFNFKLWHEEDEVRRKDVDDSIIANVKRNIDRFNQQRNDQIEKIDELLIKELIKRRVTYNDNLTMNSETPGAIIDKLSIISLKIFHMAEETERNNVIKEHIEKCKGKLEILMEQQRDLINSLQKLLEDIFEGKKKLKVYRQFKMYNDPNLNPKLYTKN